MVAVRSTPKPLDMREYMTIRKAVEEYKEHGVSARTLHRWIANGEVQSEVVPRGKAYRRYVKKSSLARKFTPAKF